MLWKIKWLDQAVKEFKKLDSQTQKNILRFLKNRIATKEDPKRFGDPLRKNLAGLWKYRVGSYRIICQIQENDLIILVVHTGHRKKIYDL